MPLLDVNKLKESMKLGKSKKEMVLVIPIVFVLIFSLYFTLFIKPVISQIRKLSPQVSKLNSELKSASRDIENRPVLENKKALFQSKIDFYEERLPSEKEIPELLESLSDIANESGVKIIGIRPVEAGRGVSTEESYKEIPISINANCAYHALGEFIEKLEIGDRFMKISNIHIEADSSVIVTHKVKLEISTYTLLKGEE